MRMYGQIYFLNQLFNILKQNLLSPTQTRYLYHLEITNGTISFGLKKNRMTNGGQVQTWKKIHKLFPLPYIVPNDQIGFGGDNGVEPSVNKINQADGGVAVSNERIVIYGVAVAGVDFDVKHVFEDAIYSAENDQSKSVSQVDNGDVVSKGLQDLESSVVPDVVIHLHISMNGRSLCPEAAESSELRLSQCKYNVGLKKWNLHCQQFKHRE